MCESNWQNIPRDDKTVKKAVLPKRGAFSFFDYSQIEPRLTAYFAARIGYPEFAETIRSGVDSYTAAAQLITGKAEVTDEERQYWKRVYLSLLYGGGMKTIQEQMGGTAAEAKKVIKTFHTNWPAVRALQDRVIAAHARRGYIVGIDGRHLHMEEHGEHKLLNKLIQGSAAGIMKRALLNVHRYLRVGYRAERFETRMVSVIHDELITDGPVRELARLHDVVPELMRSGFEHVHEIVPILVDHEVSTTNWAEKITYEEWKESLGQTPVVGEVSRAAA